MRTEIAGELKSLRLYGMASAWDELLGQGETAALQSARWLLEHATPSGHISVEHVRNVLARLSDPQRPPPADTVLALREAPRADTHRYDRLRAADAQEAGHAN